MSGLFSRPKTPAVAPPVKMADPMDPAILAERRKRAMDMQRRGGRESTILSEELSGSTGSLGG